MRTQRFVKPGELVRVIGNYSEIMTHFGLAGRPIKIELIRKEWACNSFSFMAQIYKDNVAFSSPVLPSEAGFFYDSEKAAYYTYEDDGPGDENPKAVMEETKEMIKQAFSGVDVVTITNLGLG